MLMFLQQKGKKNAKKFFYIDAV